MSRRKPTRIEKKGKTQQANNDQDKKKQKQNKIWIKQGCGEMK